jgi:hypothetical protein
VTLYIDLDTLQLVESPTRIIPIDAIEHKRGDDATYTLVFLQDGEPVALAAPVAITLAAKARRDYGGDLVLLAQSFTLDSPGPSYTGTLDYNTQPLLDLIGSSADAVDLNLELTWLPTGATRPSTTRTITLRVANDVFRGDEGTPLTLPSPEQWLADRFTQSAITAAITDKAGFASENSLAATSDLHAQATVSGNGIAITGQQISLSIGTGSTQVAAGNHAHVSVDVTDATSDGKLNPAKLIKTNASGEIKVLAAYVDTTGNIGFADGPIGGDLTNYGLFSCPSITTSPIWALPNKSGTVALTSDITASAVGLGNADNTSDATKNAATATLTNKRIPPRITTITSSATPTVNTDNCDMVTITALAEAITSMTTNLSGTPNNGEMLLYRIKDNGTARAITWGASFVAMGASLPTTTVLSKVLHVLFVWDSVTSKWGCISTAYEL